MTESGGAVKEVELETTVLGSEELKEKDCGVGAGVSSAENLSFRFIFTICGEAAAMLCGVDAGGATADGLIEGVKEKAESAEGVSEGGLEAKEKPEDPEPKGAVTPREKAEGAEVAFVVGTEKMKPDDDDDDTGAVTATLNGAAEEEAAGAEAAAEVRPRFGNVAGADGVKAAILGGWVAKEPCLGSLSPSKARVVEAETSCLTPGLRLSRANGQSNPSVDSISIMGAGGKVFSSVMWISCWLV